MAWYNNIIDNVEQREILKEAKKDFLEDIKMRKQAGWEKKEILKFWEGMALTNKTYKSLSPLYKVWIKKYYKKYKQKEK